MRVSELRPALPLAALLVARQLAGAVLDPEFGLEVGRDPSAPFDSVSQVFAFAVEYGLLHGESANPGGEELISLPLPADDISRLQILVSQLGTSRDNLHPIAAMNRYALWAIPEVERVCRRADGSYDLARAAGALKQPVGVCSLCGASIPSDAVARCSRCGSLLE